MKELAVDLGSLEPEQRAVVVAIHGGIGVTGRLDAMGIRPGIVLEKVSGQHFRGPVVVRVGNNRIALGFGMARKVQVETGRGKENVI
jgi:ferrous iron transport protein A